MKKPAKSLAKIAAGPDLARAIAALTPKQWARLHAYLHHNLATCDDAEREVLGMLMVDGSRRYARQLQSRRKVRKVLG